MCWLSLSMETRLFKGSAAASSARGRFVHRLRSLNCLSQLPASHLHSEQQNAEDWLTLCVYCGAKPSADTSSRMPPIPMAGSVSHVP